MSQEELADKLFISRQAVSKWESGQCVPDIDNIVRLSEIFGVSCDYLLKSEESTGCVTPEAESYHVRTVNRHEAEAYMALSKKGAYLVGLGVLLCIIAAIPLLLISAAIDGGLLQMNESVGFAISMTALLALAAVAVAMFIYTGIRFSAFSYLEEDFELDSEYRGCLRGQSEKINKRFSIGIIVGVSAIIVSVIPFIILGIMQISDFVTVVALCAMMIAVGLAVALIIIVGLPKGAHDRLLGIGEYSREKKRTSKALEAVSSSYWSIVLIAYLGYSFLSSNWGISWIIWPIAGVIYGVIEAVFSLKDSTKADKD
jgi:DNA-binding XRE family transcriptional regulator